MNTESDISPFLKDVARVLLQQYNNNLSSICVVFPNKRARLFFSHYLSQISGGIPVWAPSYRTITELIGELSGFVLTDKIQLIFELFSSYKEISGTEENFDDFYYYSEILLSDFDEIDKNLVNAQDLFKNLTDLKTIDYRYSYLSENQLNAIKQFWSSFSGGKSSQSQQDFLKFWELLLRLYELFRERLKKNNMAFEGMMYRDVAEAIQKDNSLSLRFDRYIFVGFNALNKCEEIIFTYLRKINKALFFWDYDDYYVGHDWHEAGLFVRENIKRFPAEKLTVNFNNLISAKKEITVLPVSSSVAQAKIIPALLQKIGITENPDLKQTAIVLPDEKLMMPVLYSLPVEIKNVNISMGYPFQASPVYSFTEHIWALYNNAVNQQDNSKTFYHKDVIAFVKHPLVYKIHHESADKLVGAIIEKNRIYISADTIRQYPGMELFFRNVSTSAEVLTMLADIFRHLIYNLVISGAASDDYLQVELLSHALNSILRIADILPRSNLTLSPKILFNVIRKILKGLTVPFAGEPLSGLQVLGILETRLLDFQHVIILSMNEGIMPRPSHVSSFIPGNLRFGFGLSVAEHHDAIYAYYFYRLIQRAKKIILVYNQQADGIFTGEPSRFIYQLKYGKTHQINEINLDSSINTLLAKPLIIQKSGMIMDHLRKYALSSSDTWLSPSAVNEYINCPYKFCLSYLLKLKEAEEVIEEIDMPLFGKLLHSTMQEIYQPYVGEEIHSEKLSNIFKQDDLIEDSVKKAFITNKLKVDKSDELTGMHLVINEIVKHYVLQILNYDKLHCPFTIVSLENKYKAVVPVQVQNKIVGVNIGGVIDRVDCHKGIIRIIDYKTGTTKQSFDGIDSLFKEIPSKRNNAVFQVFMYSWIYMENNPYAKAVPCLLYLRESYGNDFNIFLNDKSNKTEVNDFSDYYMPFSENLKLVLSEMLNPAVPFKQTSDEEYCNLTKCPYRNICHR
jgi:hypothetical protein